MENSKVDGDELDRIGQLGESHFLRLCLLAKLKGSKVEPDKTGKDFIVETALDISDPLFSVDKRPPPLQVAAQVKTILAKNDTVRIALSVAERLAKDLRPAVVCVFRIDASDDIGEMAFIHLLNDQLARVLEALRAVSSSNVERLHKKYITFTVRATDWTTASYPEFFAAIKSLATNGMLAYAEEKRRQLEELGFDDARYSMKFSLIGMTPRQVADGFLGLAPLTADKVVLAERRFEISKPMGDGPGRGELRFDPEPNQEAKLRLTSSRLGETFETACKLVTIGPNMLGEGNFAIRCDTKFGKIVISEGTLRCLMAEDFGEEDRHSLNDWRAFFQLTRLFSAGGFVLTLQSEGRDKCLVFPAEEVLAIDPEWARYAAFFDQIEIVLSAADLLETEFSLAVARQKADELVLLSKLLEAANSTFSAVVEHSPPPRLRNERSAYIAAIEVLGCWVGLFFPLMVSTRKKGVITKWSGRQNAAAVMERLDGQKLDSSFEKFRDKMTTVSGVDIVLLQEPGDFMLESPDLFERPTKKRDK